MEKAVNIGASKAPDKDLHVDIEAWFIKLLRNWWLFALFVALSLAGGYLYLRYTTYQYATRAILLIKDVGNTSVLSEESILLADEGLLDGGKSMDNEIQILKSIPLMEKCVERLEIDVTYFRQGRIKEQELYDDAHIVLDTFYLFDEGVSSGSLFLEISDHDGFTVKLNVDEEGERQTFGIPFSNKLGYFLISKRGGLKYVLPGNYRIQIRGVESVARTYAGRLQVERVGSPLNSSILQLELMDPVPVKAEHILNTLIQVYDEEEINDKNKVLRNTLKFIDQRINILTDELDSVEGKLQRFKSNNAIITNDAASSMNFTLEEIRATIQEISDLEVRKNVLASLERFLLNDQGEYELIPANLIADNAVLTSLLEQYNEKILRWDRLATKASEQNPVRIALEDELDKLRRTILITIQNQQRDLEIPIEQNKKTVEELRKKMSTVPNVEKQLIEQMRTQTIKENLFLYLLQRREETALSEAVTTANTRVIDWGRSSKSPVYPRKKLVYAACLLLGLFLPLVIVIMRTLLETKIESEETIKNLTDIPIMGRIAYHKKKGKVVVDAHSRSAISEMFRLLRTNLNYQNMGKDKQVLLITSSLSGEGKTFITANLGITLALSGKRVLLLGLDLRKPKLFEYLGLDTNQPGITDYLIGERTIPDIIHNYAEVPTLHFITSGAVPPNPAELILSEKVEGLIKKLLLEYDYVLIDTPPIGIVADALLLRKLVTNMLIVVRQKYTHKSMIAQLEEMRQRDELTSPSIVINGVKTGRKYYGYGKNYGQGYYD